MIFKKKKQLSTKFTSDKSIAIIGGGVSGLLTGILAESYGFKVTIFEKNKTIGGAFKESCELGYANNYMLLGSKFDSIRASLNEITNFSFLFSKDTDYFYLYKGKEKNIYFYKDIDFFKKQLLELFPFEENIINELINGIKDASKLDYAFKENKKNIFSFILNERKIASFYNKYGKKSIEDFASRINNADFKNALINFIDSSNSLALLILIYGLYASGKLVYVNNPIELITNLESIFTRNGGEIKTNSEVTSIKHLTKNIQIEFGKDDEKSEFDEIIYAGDCFNLFNELLPKKFYTPKARVFFENYLDSRTSSLFVLKYNLNDKDANNLRNVFNDAYLSFASTNRFKVGCRINTEFKLFLRDNKLTVSFKQNDNDFQFFKLLNKNSQTMKREITRISDDIEVMLKNNLGINKLSLDKVVTPIDFEKNFNHYKGGINGFVLSPGMIGANLDSEIKGLNNFTISSTGLYKPFWFYSSIISSKQAIRKLVEREKNKRIR